VYVSQRIQFGGRVFIYWKWLSSETVNCFSLCLSQQKNSGLELNRQLGAHSKKRKDFRLVAKIVKAQAQQRTPLTPELASVICNKPGR
jgi:hypothetical protein